jgi:hypothetical protein
MFEIARKGVAQSEIEIIPPEPRARASRDSVRCQCCGKPKEPSRLDTMEYGICQDCIACP